MLACDMIKSTTANILSLLNPHGHRKFLLGYIIVLFFTYELIS
jgi:hypothetical protein